MSDAIESFFDAWGMSDDAERSETIANSLTSEASYTDPRSSGALIGPEAIAVYVAMFSANAPGWTAQVVKSDSIGETTRATVAFGGKGPDGKEMVQHGQYFTDLKDGKISRMIGFVGTGAPE